uniref:DNA-directed RNA polymerase n=1 Tax=Gonium pectorale TaxID=33097 RepID=M1VB30_GONPE|nr:RNA polymerase alpha subunit [Gonium pectorale]BAM86000.1 RNA polymerase alpha subunit [Gonium pectorale]
MLPNTNFKNIMTKTETTDFFIACKDSRVENNTSFYGCFYLGPFEDSLSQTLANDLRRTVLSELTGIAITSVEIEGVLHKFSSLPGMKETVLDLICNLQSIVLKKKEINSTNITLRSTKKTYTGFLNVNGPRVIKAIDLKLPAGLQCVDPNQYIATLAEDGILNMKFNINEGKNFIKQKPYNLDISVLKKRNILLQNFKKKKPATSDKILFNNGIAKNNIQKQETSAGENLQSYNFGLSKAKLQITPILLKNSLSNPIPLDAVFMPVTKINCIIEENNLYSDFSTDTENIYNQLTNIGNRAYNKHKIKSPKSNLLFSNAIYKNQAKAEQMQNSLTIHKKKVNLSSPYSNFQSFLNTIDYNSIYETCLILQKNNINNMYLGLGDFEKKEVVVSKLASNTFVTEQFKLIPWQPNSFYFTTDFGFKLGLSDSLPLTSTEKQLSTSDNYYYKNNNRLWLFKKQPLPSPYSYLQRNFNFEHQSANFRTYLRTIKLAGSTASPFSKIKTFLGCKNSALFTTQTKTKAIKNKIYFSTGDFRMTNIQKLSNQNKNKIVKTVLNKPVKVVKINRKRGPIWSATHIANGVNLDNNIEYAKNFKLKPLRKKSHLIVEIWTNGSIHPRQALYQSFIFLSNNFLKLQTVKMLGSMFKSDLAYGNLKYSILNNYDMSKINRAFPSRAQTVNYSHMSSKNKEVKGRNTSTNEDSNLKSSLKSSLYNKLKFCYKKTNFSANTKTSLNDIKFYLQTSLKAPIGILTISLRVYTALKKAGIFTLNDLITYSKNDLLKIKNLGTKSLFEIETSLSYLGLTLKK